MMNVSIGGVPEHFNLPWQQAVTSDVFAEAGLNVSWTYHSGGTGSMIRALANQDLDLAILLTEGFVSAFNDGLKARIVKVYIDTPLVWGIYTASPDVHAVGDGHGKYAISRFGSGSHLMAMIHAEQRGTPITEADCTVVHSLEGAINSLQEQRTSYFYWEKFMTRPFVKSGQVRLIGEFSAPWSGFLVAASDDALSRKSYSIKSVLDIMNNKCRLFVADDNNAHELARRFSMTYDEALKWMHDTRWNNNFNIPADHLTNARQALARIGKCAPDLNLESCCAPWLKMI